MARATHDSVWLALALAVAIIAALPRATSAQSPKASVLWLASAATSPGDDAEWGRLMLKDGILTFASTTSTWETPLNEIKRVSESTRARNTIEIETLNGEKLMVSILGRQMVTESPRKAMRTIERARRIAPPAGRAATLVAAAGGGRSQF
jgi:hypothetical protein